MSEAEYCGQQSLKGFGKEDAKEAWRIMIESGHDEEGEGTSRKLWIAEHKKRFRDKTFYEDGGWDEGGSVTKNASPEEREKMKAWAAESVTFGTTFLMKGQQDSSSGSRSASASAAEIQAKMENSSAVEIGLAAPALHKSSKK